jgi:hypothetical protein
MPHLTSEFVPEPTALQVVGANFGTFIPHFLFEPGGSNSMMTPTPVFMRL